MSPSGIHLYIHPSHGYICIYRYILHLYTYIYKYTHPTDTSVYTPILQIDLYLQIHLNIQMYIQIHLNIQRRYALILSPSGIHLYTHPSNGYICIYTYTWIYRYLDVSKDIGVMNVPWYCHPVGYICKYTHPTDVSVFTDTSYICIHRYMGINL